MEEFAGSAIAGTVGSVASSAWNWLTGRNNRDWQEKMANTAYQRSTADMRAAGLNPSMMYGSGAAAMTPNPAPTAPASNPVQGVPELAVSAARLANETRVSEATAGKLDAEQAAISGYHGTKAGAETDLARAHTRVADAEIPNIVAKLKEIGAEVRLKTASARSVESELPRKEAVATAVRELGAKVPYEKYVQPVMDHVFGTPGAPRPYQGEMDKADQTMQWLKRQMGRAYKKATSGNVTPEESSARQMMGGY
jgi:hypothetical protein